MIGAAVRPPRPIALIGLPGTGKTTLGRLLAARLGWELRDTDEVIERSGGRTAARIIEEDGEAELRRREAEVVAGLLAGPRPLVIACGGGLFTEEDARRTLLRDTWVVALDAADATLVERLGAAADRPLLRGDVARRLGELRRRREAAYGQAHLRLDTGCTLPEAAVTAISRVADAIAVPLGEHAYPVVVGEGAADHLEMHLPAASRRVVVVADGRVEPFARRLAVRLRERGRDASLVKLRGGEGVKSWTAAGRLIERLAGLGLGRRDALVAVGGGSVGDVAGFAAAAYCRGIAWVVVPTTLLAMVDSAIGGKTAVNLRAAKNMVGAFWQPRAVLADPTVLDTLAGREMASGLAEVAKYAMIAATDLPDLLDAGVERVLGGDVHELTAIVERCAAIKAEVVGADPTEAGLRAVLNYGHTAAHAIEAATGYGPVTHGEAVAVGMRIAGRLSVKMLSLPARDLAWQDRLLDRLGLPPLPPVDPDEVVARLGRDKKSVGGEPRWVLLGGRGLPRVGQRVPAELVRATITEVLRG
jgi:shikimate kinase/3-dehydroquinate synthase